MPRSRRKADDDRPSPYIVSRWICWGIAAAIFLAFAAIALGWTQVTVLAPGTAVVFVVLEFTLIIGGLGAGLGHNKREVMDELELIEDRVAEKVAEKVAEVVAVEVGKLQPAISSDLGRLAAQSEQAYVQMVMLREEQERLEERIESAARTMTADALDELKKEIRDVAQTVEHAYLVGFRAAITQPRRDRDDSVEGTIVVDDASLDPQYLADMARSVELGREMERRKHMDSAD